jgi:hypothetical protein
MRIAVAMMCLGVCPFLLGLAWAVSSLSYARHHPGAADGPGTALLGTVLLGAYVFALLVSGGGALLSYWAGKRWAEPVAGLGTARTVVAVALALPLFLYGVLRFPLI